MNACLTPAEKHAFAVYQTVYSGADTELHFDWRKRLDDTKWAEDAYYWVMLDGQRIGGIMILEDCTRFPFLIEPFQDRALFWHIVLRHLRAHRPDIDSLYSVLDADIPVLLSYGYQVERTRRMMCRPTEAFALAYNDQYTYHIPSIADDLDELEALVVHGYEDGIDRRLDPETSAQEIGAEARSDLRFFLEGYAATGTLHHSLLIREKETNAPAALCVAGRHPLEDRPRFAYVAELAVLPAHRHQGLATLMLQNALAQAAPDHDLLLLCVTIGNNAEALYHHLGFWAGPAFTNMVGRRRAAGLR